MQITKNIQSEAAIKAMAAKAFPGVDVTEIEELNDGMCNALYLLTFADGSKSVLKIASAGNAGKMTYEQNLMETEVLAMELVKKQTSIPLPAVQHYDDSRTICDGKYFFMEYIDGDTMNAVLMAEALKIPNIESKNPFTVIQTLPEFAPLRMRVGELVREMITVTNDAFGSVGGGARYESMYDYMKAITEEVFDDAARAEVDLGISREEVLIKLAEDKAVFDEVTVPRLVHQDIWEGNIMMKDGKVVGIIDWERSVWGDPLMEARFRTHVQNPDFLKGYGISGLSAAETRRCLWYDAWAALAMMTIGIIREYGDDRQFRYAKMLFGQAWKALDEK